MELSTQEALRPLAEIMTRHGATCTLAEFHSAVNVTFHEFESEVYDQEHADMWNSVPREVQLLVSDCLESATELPSNLHLLDIGCGTGLASQCLLWTELGKKISSVDLLDTSPSMLRQATKRSSSWGIPVQTFNGLIDQLPPEKTYDVIITCSVLHHVPDLAGFLAAVRHHQAENGFFLHLQDPNGDFLDDLELKQRQADFNRSQAFSKSIARLAPSRVLGSLYRKVTGAPSNHYVAKTNRALIAKGVITSPLTFLELYSITDIHVEDGGGISLRQLKQWLPEYNCVSQRSYGFFGALRSELPERMKRVEDEQSRARAMNGFHVGAAWRLRGK
jgi:SAM-dependent methyltransferase